MMEVNSLFSFSFGGKNNFGEEIRVAESKVMDFSPKPCGVGFAVRTGHEVDDFHRSEINTFGYYLIF